MNKFYVIKELATGLIMIKSEDLDEIIELFKNYDKNYFILEDNLGNEVKEND